LSIAKNDLSHAYDTALWALGEIGALRNDVIPTIAAGLGQPTSDRRWWAAKALGVVGADAVGAVSQLEQSLHDNHSIVRELAAWALGEIGPGAAAAVPTLRMLVSRDLPEVRYRAESAISAITHRKAPRAGNASPNDERRPVTVRQGTKELVRELRSSDPKQRRKAASELGEIGTGAAVSIPEMIRLMDDEVTDVARAAATALGKIGRGSAAAVEALVNRMRQAPAEILAVIDWAVGLLGPEAEAAVPALESQLIEYSGIVHRNLEIRYHAVWALARIDFRGQAVVESLVQALGDVDSDVRAIAAENLGYIGRPAAAALGNLLALKNDRHLIVRHRAEWAVRRMGS
jgi:HEAT repeat protein